MDFLDPDKKKKHVRRLYFGYFLVAVAIILASVVLLFQALGYDLDRKTGQVIQNGLIFFDSQPESATIYLNGEDKGQTASRLTVPAGQYTAELRRSGYKTWKRSFNLEGSSIERLVYPVLFPEKLNTQELRAYGGVTGFATQSPDRQWILTQKPGSLTLFEQIDANKPKDPVREVAVPVGVLTASPGEHALKAVEWSTDNRHVLLQHIYKDGTEFVMIDRETPASSFNVNKLFAQNPSKVSLRDKKYDQLYLYDSTARTLQRADAKTKQVAPLLSGVLAYKSYGADTLLYAATDSTKPDATVVRIRDGDKTYPLRSYINAGEFHLDITRFDEQWYAVVGATNEGRVSIYKNPMTRSKNSANGLPQAHTVLIMKDPRQVLFSANARFILTQNGNQFAIYDAETNRRHYYAVDLPISAELKATWMDGHRLLVNTQSNVHVFDFDGINQRQLVRISPDTVPFFDRDYNRLYTLAPSSSSADKTTLTYTPLKTDLKD